MICVFTGNLQQPPAFLCIICLQCFDTVVWMTGTTSSLYKAVCWFVGGDIVTGALHDLQLQLSPPPYSSKVQNGDILVLANLDPRGKWPLTWREIAKLTLIWLW